jgi:hypothetical protein
MRNQIQWLALVIAFVTAIAGSMGCATMAASSLANRAGGNQGFYTTPVLSDEIVAMGKPDAVLAKEIGQEHVVAFIGKQKTYLLYKGGEELEAVSKLKLEWDGSSQPIPAGSYTLEELEKIQKRKVRMLSIDATGTQKLYKRDRQVWGEISLIYGNGVPISSDAQEELKRGGFVPARTGGGNRYQKRVVVEGIVYPPIKLPEGQVATLNMRYSINLYNSPDTTPPKMPEVFKSLLTVTLVTSGILFDIAHPFVGIAIFWMAVAAH